MMLVPAVLMNFPYSEVCLIGEWSIEYKTLQVSKTIFDGSIDYNIVHTNIRRVKSIDIVLRVLRTVKKPIPVVTSSYLQYSIK